MASETFFAHFQKERKIFQNMKLNSKSCHFDNNDNNDDDDNDENDYDDIAERSFYFRFRRWTMKFREAVA